MLVVAEVSSDSHSSGRPQLDFRFAWATSVALKQASLTIQRSSKTEASSAEEQLAKG